MAPKHFKRYARKPKTKRYWASGRRFLNKYKRVEKSSGIKAARQYRLEYGPGMPKARRSRRR